MSSNLVLVDTCRQLPGMRVLIFHFSFFFFLSTCHGVPSGGAEVD